MVAQHAKPISLTWVTHSSMIPRLFSSTRTENAGLGQQVCTTVARCLIAAERPGTSTSSCTRGSLQAQERSFLLPTAYAFLGVLITGEFRAEDKIRN
jgi:hypothetical protein